MRSEPCSRLLGRSTRTLRRRQLLGGTQGTLLRSKSRRASSIAWAYPGRLWTPSPACLSHKRTRVEMRTGH